MSLELAAWASRNGIKTDTTYIDDGDESAGRCLRASRNIRKGEKVLFCPPKFIINNQFIISHTNIGKYLMQYPQELDPMQLMMAFLILEFDKGSKSEFQHFILSLPKSFSLPVVWNRRIGELLPSELTGKYTDFCDYVKDCCCKVKKIAAEYNMSITSDEIMWAFCCVNTRCFYVAEHLSPLLDCSRIKNNMVLIPYLDMCNHNPDVCTDYDVNVDGCDIFATSDIEKDAEICLNYGMHNNYVLLIEYGFVCGNNSNDCVNFTEDDLIAALKGFSDKLKTSKEFSKLCKKELFFVSEGQPSWALVTMLAALKTNDFEYFFEQYFGGYLEFPRQPKLVEKVRDWKTNYYRELLGRLNELALDGEKDRQHREILRSLLESRIDMLKSVGEG